MFSHISIYVLVSYKIYIYFLSMFDCANLSNNYDLVEVRRAFDSDLAAFFRGFSAVVGVVKCHPGSLNATHRLWFQTCFFMFTLLAWENDPI